MWAVREAIQLKINPRKKKPQYFVPNVAHYADTNANDNYWEKQKEKNVQDWWLAQK